MNGKYRALITKSFHADAIHLPTFRGRGLRKFEPIKESIFGSNDVIFTKQPMRILQVGSTLCHRENEDGNLACYSFRCGATFATRLVFPLRAVRDPRVHQRNRRPAIFILCPEVRLN